MKCLKCKHEIEEDDKFCPECGEKVMVKDGDMDLIEMFKQSSAVWFSLGVKYGILHERKDFEEIKTFEEGLNKDREFSKFYQKSLEYAKDNILTKLDKVGQTKGSYDRNAH